jgi:hypothetical protein
MARAGSERLVEVRRDEERDGEADRAMAPG